MSQDELPEDPDRNGVGIRFGKSIMASKDTEPNFILLSGMDGRPGQEVPPVLPVFPTRGFVVFPLTIVPIVVTDKQLVQLLNDASMGNKLIALVGVKPDSPESAQPELANRIGTMGHIVRLLKGSEGDVQVLIQGQERIAVDSIASSSPYIRGQVSRRPEVPLDRNNSEAEAGLRTLVSQFSKLVSLASHLTDDLALNASRMDDPRQLVYLIASALSLDMELAQNVLETDSIKDKIEMLRGALSHEIEVLEIGRKILSDTKSEVEKTQREYFLRQQMKAIQNELGEGEEQNARVGKLKEKIDKAGMPEEAREEALHELGRLTSLSPGSPEYPVIETYLEWLADLPWNVTTSDDYDVEKAREILDADHYDLKEIKERILEFLSVRKLKHDRSKGQLKPEEGAGLRKEREGAILCFVGPPGVGKTSLGLSIARALGRKFIRASLGGLHDEAEIRGHRRTYIGAVPGRIIQYIRRVGTKNPVFMLDEVDKIGSDWRGDPSSALLEVLDPEQNREFRDNYLNVSFDLSEVLFIATANLLDTVPPPLRDRMEVVQLSGYTDQEKTLIARQYLVPRQIRDNGLDPDEISFPDDTLLAITREYTREAGVRELERRIGQVCRRVAVEIAQGTGQHKEHRIDLDELRKILGKAAYYYEARERTDVPGVAVGVAVTATGGEIIFVEVTRMRGNRGFSLTGQLGEVMKESAQAAFSLIRSKVERLGIPEDFFEKNDIHIHVPAGAIPKDGPSAGVTMAAAIASLATNRQVRGEVAMTGEISLRGKVLPVGGIKEKAVAAHRAGMATLIVPAHNEKDLDDVPDEVKNEMRLLTVDNIDDLLALALETSARAAQPENEKHAAAG